MQLTLMLRFKLVASKEQKQKLLETAKAYTEAVNFVLSENLKDKTTKVKKLHRLYYSSIRKAFNLPAQLAINVYRDVAAIYKTLWAQYKELKRRKERYHRLRLISCLKAPAPSRESLESSAGGRNGLRKM